MAKLYDERPSVILGVADAWAAYQLDAIVMDVGIDWLSQAPKQPVKKATKADLMMLGIGVNS